MVAVVIIGADKRAQRREHLAADAERLHALGVAVGQAVERARAVIEHAHLDAGAHLFLKDLEDAAPDVALLDDEVFQKNEPLGRLQRVEQRADLILPHGVVGDGGVFIHRIVAGAQRVLGKVMHLGQLGAQTRHEPGLPRHILHGAHDALLHAAVGIAVADIELHEQVQQHAERGQRHDEHDPCDLCRRAAGLVDQMDDEHDRQRVRDAGQRGVIAAEIVRAEHHHADLQQQQHDNDHRAAEHDVQQAALAAAQQTDLVVVLEPDLAHKRTSSAQSFRRERTGQGIFIIIAEIRKTFKAFRRFSGRGAICQKVLLFDKGVCGLTAAHAPFTLGERRARLQAERYFLRRTCRRRK